jgi:hypothetical protein
MPFQWREAPHLIKNHSECRRKLNMDFLKELFDQAENAALTYGDFSKAVKSKGFKLADLSNGDYVAKKKYEDDLKTKDTIIADLNATIDTNKADLQSFKEKLDKAGTDSTKIETLSNDLQALQAKYESETRAYQDKLNAQAYEFAVNEYSNTLQFTSEAAKREFRRAMKEKQLPMENGNIMGASDYMNEYAKSNADSFVQPKSQEQQPPAEKPKFASGTNDPNNTNGGGKKQSLSELMRAKNDNPSLVVDFG